MTMMPVATVMITVYKARANTLGMVRPYLVTNFIVTIILHGDTVISLSDE